MPANEHEKRQRGWLVCLLLALPVSLVSGCGSDPIPTTALPPMESEPALKAALEKHHEAASSDLTDGQRRGELAIALDANGFDEEAIDVYAAAAELSPDEFDWPYFRALLVAQVRSDYADALTSINAAIAIDESYVPAWLSRGAWLRALGRP